MSPALKVSLGILGGVAAGGALGYYIANTRRGQKALQAAEDVIVESGVRLPEPSFAVELPYDEEQFEILDELVCECGKPIITNVSPTATVDEVTLEIQDCMARELYPDFPWPPVPGDHPTVAQLYAELGVMVRRAIATAEICPQPIPPVGRLPVPQPNPGNYQW